MLKLLFIGSMVPRKIKEKIKYNSEAANNFQINLYEELEKYFDIKILSYYGYKIENFNFQEEEDYVFVYKYQFYKNPLKFFWINLKKIKKIIRESDVLLCYNHNYFNMIINLLVFSKQKKYLILADFIQPFEEKNLIKKVLAYIYKKQFSKYDGLICLSKNTMNYNRNSINILGGIDSIAYKKFTPTPKGEKIKILYSGFFEKVPGIDLYLESIEKIDNPNIEFIFTGKGSLENIINEKSKKDNRIKNLGFLSKEEFVEILNSANILINPRNMKLNQNQNNFPSKILEYISSGKVIVSTKFVGYEEFSDNINFCESNSESIKDMISDIILRYDEIYLGIFKENIKKAKNYEWYEQAMKIEKFITNEKRDGF